MALRWYLLGRRMKHTAIIPNREIVLSPPEPHLKIVIVYDRLQEIVLEDLALAGRDAVDPAVAHLAAGAEERFPARHWVGTCA